MKVYYKEFEDLESLNEWIRLAVEEKDVISINYADGKHCMYFWQ
jgi:hypothetical protein